MQLHTPIVALIMGALVFTSFFSLFMHLASENQVPIDLTDYNVQGGNKSLYSAFATINQTKEQMDNITVKFYNQTVTESAGGGLFGFFSLTYQIGVFISQNLISFQQIMQATMEIIGAEQVYNIIFTLLGILFFIFVLSVLLILMGRIYA